jgi:hypothetical protein
MKRSILLPLAITAAILFGACGVNIDVDIDRGSGNVIREARSLETFDRVVLHGLGDLTVSQGEQESLEIEAEDNVLPYIETEVRDGVLEIRYERKTILPTKPVKFHLVMRELRGLDTRGVSNILADGVATDRLQIGISGTGNVNIRDLRAGALAVNVSGAGNCTVDGTAGEQAVTLSGAGSYNGGELASGAATVTITGLGKVTVWAQDSLNVTISGTGGVDYYGSPQVRQQISGLGQVNHLGSK